MVDSPNDEQLLFMFKALSDANRLKIIGLLARQPYSVEQLATILSLRPSTVSHHLKILSEASLVSARVESYYNIYRLQPGVLEEMARRLLSHQAFPPPDLPVEISSFQAKVIKDYLMPDGTLKTIPAQRRKLEVILNYLLQAFTPGVRYSEKQVNEILSGYHPDSATLRRELVGYHFMARAEGEYWLVDPEKEKN